jgi:hypothetical protein
MCETRIASVPKPARQVHARIPFLIRRHGDEPDDPARSCAYRDGAPWSGAKGVGPRVQVGGLLVVAATGFRLLPREVHYRRGLVNWLPRRVDQLLSGRQGWMRGVWSWSVRYGFRPHYRNLEPTIALGLR